MITVFLMRNITPPFFQRPKVDLYITSKHQIYYFDGTGAFFLYVYIKIKNRIIEIEMKKKWKPRTEK